MDFNLESLCAREAQRRLKLLGSVTHADASYDELRVRAIEVYVPFRVFWHWRQEYIAKGRDGLIPSWQPLAPVEQTRVQERYNLLLPLAETEVITPTDIEMLATSLGWQTQRVRRLLTRYRTDGLWGLASYTSTKPHKRKSAQPPPRELATLDEAALNNVYHRRELLGSLVNTPTVSDADVRTRANEVGTSARTLWNYLSAYRQYGLAGLAPRQRSVGEQSYRISPRMRRIITGFYLSNPDQHIRSVWEAACTKAQLLGEDAPSEWQVRSICNNIPAPIQLLAAGRTEEFRNKYRFTYRLQFDDSHVIYFFDHTQIDVLVKDQRDEKVRTQGGEIRPWLSLALCPAPRLCVAAIFSYDQPNRFTVASLLRDALLMPLEKPYGGLPSEVWVDRGKDLVSRHVRELTRELGIHLHLCAPHQPQQKGIIERFFGTLNTRLWSTFPGYVNSNVVDRNPSVKAEFTITEVVERFWEFIERYHQEVHSETGMTPMGFWDEHCLSIPADPRELDVLLKESDTRRVIKIGIKFEGQTYWHADLAPLVGQDVVVRSEATYPLEEIEVFHDGRWICTALTGNALVKQGVERGDVAEAQRAQRRDAKSQINAALAELHRADEEIRTTSQSAIQQTGPTEDAPINEKSSTEKEKKEQPTPGLLDLL